MIDIKEGDCIIEINGQNVSRASARSIRKIIKSSKELKMSLMRSNHLSATIRSQMKSNNADNQITSFIKKKCNSSIRMVKEKIDITTKTCKIQSTQLKSLISCIRPFGIASITKKVSVEEVITSESFETVEVIRTEIEKISSVPREETIDYGYHSIPRASSCESQISAKQSYSSLSTSSSKSSGFCEEETHTPCKDVISSFKADLENFIREIQCGIETYVRPSVVFNILSQLESFDLYQNVEKLIPVAKFLLNIIGQLDNNPCALNVDSMNLVLTTFKTYLSGLAKSIQFLHQLSTENDEFILFLEKLNDIHRSLPIFDFVFMPFNFVCSLIEFLEEVSNDDNKLKSSVNELYVCSLSTQATLEQCFEE